ncbi:MAG: hypothetical protein ACREJB_14315 [Planctomycetaceae bacterium]
MMTTMVWTYLVYLALTVAVTVWVARTLRKSGTVFLVDGEEGNHDVTHALSHLLIVGFYLVNLGVISLALKFGELAIDVEGAIEVLSLKVGGILVVLGAMHFLILVVLAKTRRGNRAERTRRDWNRT